VTARMVAGALTAGRRAVALAAAGILLATLAVIGTSAAAQAATCSGTSEQVIKPVGTADFTWAVCSDSSIQVWNGTIHDTLCDSRMARVRFVASYEYTTTPTWVELTSSLQYKADSGCGTYDSFPRVTLHPRSSPGDCLGCAHRLQAQVVACNGNVVNPCSSTYVTNYSFVYPGQGGGGGCATPARTEAASRVPASIPCAQPQIPGQRTQPGGTA
jgi:hypothetical protein